YSLTGYKGGKEFRNDKNNVPIFQSANSITSSSLNVPSSTVNLTNVRTLWNPDIPAAPGLICSMPSVLSYFTFNIWECPLINSLGGCTIRVPMTEESYF